MGRYTHEVLGIVGLRPMRPPTIFDLMTDAITTELDRECFAGIGALPDTSDKWPNKWYVSDAVESPGSKPVFHVRVKPATWAFSRTGTREFFYDGNGVYEGLWEHGMLVTNRSYVKVFKSTRKELKEAVDAWTREQNLSLE